MPPKTVGRKRAEPDEVQPHIEAAAVLRQLECSVCLEIILPPILQCELSHLLCTRCWNKLPTPRKCPTCRVALGSGRCHALEQLAAALSVPCRHALRGCTWVTSYSAAADHGSVCDFRDVTCPESGCDWKGCRTALMAHFEDSEDHHVSHEDSESVGLFVLQLGVLDEHGAVRAGYNHSSYNFDGHGFISVMYTHHDDESTSLQMLFCGPESERRKYKYKYKLISNEEDVEDEVQYKAVPLSIHMDHSEEGIRNTPGLHITMPTLRRLCDNDGYWRFEVKLQRSLFID